MEKGKKTRNNKMNSDRFILDDRYLFLLLFVGIQLNANSHTD